MPRGDSRGARAYSAGVRIARMALVDLSPADAGALFGSPRLAGLFVALEAVGEGAQAAWADAAAHGRGYGQRPWRPRIASCSLCRIAPYAYPNGALCGCE